jgi:hypothetical protein
MKENIQTPEIFGIIIHLEGSDVIIIEIYLAEKIRALSEKVRL